MGSEAEQPTTGASGLNISGSGWSCALSSKEAGELADRLRFEGSWSLGYRVRAMRTLALEDREKSAMLKVVSRMGSLGLGTPRTFVRFAAYLEDDLYADS